MPTRGEGVAMSESGIAALMERYLDDAEFRAEFARDPERAVTDAGIELSADELAALHAADGVHPAEVLKARISRAAFGLST